MMVGTLLQSWNILQVQLFSLGVAGVMWQVVVLVVVVMGRSPPTCTRVRSAPVSGNSSQSGVGTGRVTETRESNRQLCIGNSMVYSCVPPQGQDGTEISGCSNH